MGVAQFIVDERLIESPAATLATLLEAGRERREREQAAAVIAFAEGFTREYGVKMRFSDDAVTKLIARADREKVSVAHLCARLVIQGLRIRSQAGATQRGRGICHHRRSY